MRLWVEVVKCCLEHGLVEIGSREGRKKETHVCSYTSTPSRPLSLFRAVAGGRRNVDQVASILKETHEQLDAGCRSG